MAQTKKNSSAKGKAMKSKPVKSAKKAVPARAVLAKKAAKTAKVSAKTAKAAKPAKASAKATKPAQKSSQKNSSLMNKNSFATAVGKKNATPRIPNSFKPLDDRIIISVEPMAEKTAGGIIIPGSVSERPSRGTVLATGPGRRNKKGVVRPLDVNVGDTVLFPQFAGQKIEIGADEFLILREEEVLGIQLA